MSLSDYKKKRDPTKTPEPFSGGRRRSKQPIFVIQRHDARRLHYDFRLEEDGALASWAVPKGVPLEPGGRALAVHVEDHPLEYAKFEGQIPAGQYGAGSVEIWDSGTYELLERKKNGQRTIALHGKRLEGTWSLIPAHLDGKEENWLLIKRRDGDSGELATRRYRPMLATQEDTVPHGDDWRYEVKFDGYRAIAYVHAGECELVSRNGNDLTERFAQVAKEVVKATKSPNAVLDGEVTRVDAQGRASFSELQRGSGSLVYFVFDLLELDGEPLTELPFSERKARLRKLLDRRNKCVSFSDDFDDGDALYEAASQSGLEGIVAKRAGSTYKEGKRTRDWLKIKVRPSQEFLIAGYTVGQGKRARLGSLVLAYREGEELRYAGNCGTGFTESELDRLLDLMQPLRRDTAPITGVPREKRLRGANVVWLEPRLVCEVEFAEWTTRSGELRHPSFKGLRWDKASEEVVRED
jgi:bifunctional non-homologous end joining protein LigD